MWPEKLGNINKSQTGLQLVFLSAFHRRAIELRHIHTNLCPVFDCFSSGQNSGMWALWFASTSAFYTFDIGPFDIHTHCDIVWMCNTTVMAPRRKWHFVVYWALSWHFELLLREFDAGVWWLVLPEKFTPPSEITFRTLWTYLSPFSHVRHNVS